MKRLLLLLPLLVLSGCSSEIGPSPEQLCSSCLERIEGRIKAIEDRNSELGGGQKVLDDKINAVDKGTTKLFGDYDINIQPDNDIYCHESNDIKIGDNVYFAYLGNRTIREDKKSVIIDGITVYYDIQPAVEILREMVEGKDCITMINGYGTEPQKTYSDMIKHIKAYFKAGGNN